VGKGLAEPVKWTAGDWHRRFSLQARWTEQIRQYCLQQLHLDGCRSLIEVGCGTGAICASLQQATHAKIVGLDLRPDFLGYARFINPLGGFIQGDALSLPVSTASFGCAVCHYFLLWAGDPVAALVEMRRVVQPGGWVIALAEPDYGGRIDYPDILSALGWKQAAALNTQGADTNAGRKLAAWLHQAGLKDIQVGLLGGQWGALPPSQEELESEYEMIEADLSDSSSPVEVAKLINLDAAAWRRGERILYVPTFYGWGRV
jgi:ubiquinone/menaquinone biosynthesis C-methylase UbiE